MVELIPHPQISGAQLQTLFDYRLNRIRSEMVRQGLKYRH